MADIMTVLVTVAMWIVGAMGVNGGRTSMIGAPAPVRSTWAARDAAVRPTESVRAASLARQDALFTRTPAAITARIAGENRLESHIQQSLRKALVSVNCRGRVTTL